MATITAPVMLLVAHAACGFSVDLPVTDAARSDTSLDDGPRVDADAAQVSPCASDPTLRLCFSFDAPTLSSPLANEVAGAQPAMIGAVTRIERSPGNGAAQFTAQSSMRIAMDPTVVGIATLEAAFRADALPANRAGLLDSNTSSNISLFLHPQSAGYTLRCGIGAVTENWLVPVTAGEWHHVACVCEAAQLTLYVDGVAQPSRQGECGGGAIIGDGFTIGSNNTGSAVVFDDQLVGAFDYVRLWSVPRTAAQIVDAAHAR